MTRKRILFLCTGNAARSQMAEGLMRAFYGDQVDVVSAGSRPAGWGYPLALGAAAGVGIDNCDALSERGGPFLDQQIDGVVNLCDSAPHAFALLARAARVAHCPLARATL